MTNGVLKTHLLRTGLSVVAALLLSSAAMAQDVVATDDAAVSYAVDPAVETEAGYEAGSEGDPDVIIDDGAYLPGDDGTVEGEKPVDGGDDWTWVDPGTDDGTIIWIDDGACIGVDCVPGDDSYTYDGDGGEVVYFDLGGPRPEDCPECRDLDLPVWAYQTGAPMPTVTESAPAAKPRRSKSASGLASDAAACLALHPQLPWLCEWQNGAGH